MKNIFLFPTDKPSRLHITSKLMLYPNGLMPKSQGLCKNQHIYITSKEYIGLSYYLDGDLVRKGVIDDKDYWEVRKDYEKIILTTDPKLIEDGVQAIDDEFLEWFVKNPSCEKVDVDYRYDTNLQPILDSFGNKVLRIKIPTESENLSQIIIPKEGMNCWSGKKGVEGWPGKEEPKQEIPTELESVLAKITHQNDLGLSQWYEVVYYDDNKWCSYSGSKTFQDGERVIEWKYCKDCL